MVPLFIVCCEKLEQEPKDVMTKQAVFNTESGIDLYINSFYTIVPDASVYFPLDREGVGGVDVMADYLAKRDIPDFIKPGAYGPMQSTGWTWTYLRNVNYFIDNIKLSNLAEPKKMNYIGIARFFRAWFYFEKVKRFGDVPWIGKALDVADPELFNGRDSRVLVMDSVLADIDFACQNISLVSDPSRTLITKYVALALKSRICLFEGTFRKYHDENNLQGSANYWLTEAANAAKIIMDEASFSLNQGEEGYRNLFISPSPVSTEVILATLYSKSLGLLHAGNWYMVSPSYGCRGSLIRTFINTYLNIDGTPFTDNPDYSTMTFQEETKDRDLRLKQTIKTKGYGRINKGSFQTSPPLFSYTYTGYQLIKWTMDDVAYDDGTNNDNAIIAFRYAEVLLNYAEAKAELGTLTDEDWKNTIGAIRQRAGITGGISNKPTTIDSYIQQHYFPEISDPVILEIRRERGIELVLEGFRFYDLVRWKKGKLLEMEWNGMYVTEIEKYIDLDEDGRDDVYFYSGTAPEESVAGVTYVNVSPILSDGQVNPFQLINGDHGEIKWLHNIQKKWEDKYYLYPIPEADRLVNPELGQNPGW